MGTLTDDHDFLATTFVVLDFEGTTPRGFRPEPIEVAAIAVCHDGRRLAEAGRFEELIRPPAHAPVTPADTALCGICPADVARARPAGEVLADLDDLVRRFKPYAVVAQAAHVEAGILFEYRECCPSLASTDLLDTIRMARQVRPGLVSYGLDRLMSEWHIPRPADRHRAMPDAEATLALFGQLLADGAVAGHWRTLAGLRRITGVTARADRPAQGVLF